MTPVEAVITVAIVLIGALGLARALLRRAEDSSIQSVDDNLPICPDYIPEWMMGEPNAR